MGELADAGFGVGLGGSVVGAEIRNVVNSLIERAGVVFRCTEVRGEVIFLAQMFAGSSGMETHRLDSASSGRESAGF